jgi:hypothetical protein
MTAVEDNFLKERIEKIISNKQPNRYLKNYKYSLYKKAIFLKCLWLKGTERNSQILQKNKAGQIKDNLIKHNSRQQLDKKLEQEETKQFLLYLSISFVV